MGSVFQIQHSFTSNHIKPVNLNCGSKQENPVSSNTENDSDVTTPDVEQKAVYRNDIMALLQQLDNEIHDLQRRVKLAKKREKDAQENFKNTLITFQRQYIRKR
ncbi:hypothetical protein TraAM80_09116 [Trypanosoma rangeli]|uniref:Uncharacterized protein n=1 Tax=Trypanosoma rangeli TaxID=5698 RepID=A0A422MY01_TRYRA|nr:uncharacterized protein TraAM80_09116 [Trypanosoma rangeli]RNE98050.1 hypothetical protein TraAM80_09116 [Trypanosoma rangeli]|eukprot:RNE98050.1 hypothetical protein TraAM80_09116 [Trypanosoma rangeli]